MAGDATIVAGRRVAERYRLVERRENDACWDAVDETLKRNVVVQVLAPDADQTAKKHFTDEARTLARLNHPNVVSTYDTGVDGDGTSYRVDELSTGRPLDLHDVGDARRLSHARQIAQAFADAHAVGLVHGTLRSAHVLVDDAGRVQVRGLRLPHAAEDAEAAKQRDLEALVGLIVGLAPPGNAPLRDVAVGWRRSPPHSASAMLDELATLGDDLELPDPVPTPAVGVPPVRRESQGRRAIVVGLAALAAAALAAAVLLPASRNGDNFGGPVQPLVLTAKSFDPEGSDRTENEAQARLAVDGNAATGWATERYRRANFANLKDGLGLILQAQAGTAAFADVTITSPTRGWDVQLYVADQPAATLPGWGAAIASATVREQRTTIALPERSRGGAVLLWISATGPNRQVRINEVVIQGRS